MLAGSALMTAAFCIFALAGAIAKVVIAAYSVGEVIVFRSVIALLLLLPFVIRDGGLALRTMQRSKLQLLRVCISVVEVTLFFLSVSYLPLADTLSIFMSGPIVVALWSMIFLGEQVEWRRIAAIVVGFAGVVIAMRPSATTFTPLALIPLAGVMCYAGTVLTTRALRGTPGTVLTINQMAGAALLGIAATALSDSWTTPSPSDFGLLFLIGALSALAYVCMNRAIGMAPANVVAPYQYTLVIWGAVFGFLFFGDVPALATWIGAAIIAGAGLYLSWRDGAVRSAAAS